ncbi:MAG: 50S ribosomal protein L4 [Actinobacteria bacterium]|nr:50S ribosomal protein L4 [Actinomycetota bacterium]
MADLSIRTITGGNAGSVTLADTVFGVQPNVPVMHQVVTAQLAAARAGTQSTLTRAEVRGGGKKPWRQKGTGRARQGSIRAPQWAGGGVALGPKPRSYAQRTPKKMIALALRSALSDRANEGRVVVVDNWNFEKPSTKAAVAALKALGVSDSVLVVISREDEDAFKSFRNLPEVQCILSGELNTYDVLNNDWIVFSTSTLPGADAVADVADVPAPVAEEPPVAEEAPVATEPVAQTPEEASE